VAYGVDLGNPEYAEWNFETDEDYGLPAPYGDDESPEWDDLLAEFAGWDETELPYGEPYSVEHRKWSAQRERKRAVLATVAITQSHYGYEYSGIYLSVGQEHRVAIDCAPLGRLDLPDYQAAARLQDFIEFLDSKGLVLKPEHRQPHWLLMATYG
jgi:hypothetical protein